MNLLSKITACSLIFGLASCGNGESKDLSSPATSPNSKSLAVWSFQKRDYHGFEDYSLNVIGHNGEVDPSPPQDFFETSAENLEGYFEVEYNCNPSFGTKVLNPDSYYETDDEEILTTISFDDDDDNRMDSLMDSVFMEFDYENADQRPFFEKFATSRKNVKILIGSELIIIPMKGFEKAHNSLPEECRMDKAFSLAALAKVKGNKKELKKRKIEAEVASFMAKAKAQFPASENVVFRKTMVDKGTVTVCGEASGNGEDWQYFVYDHNSGDVLRSDAKRFETIKSLCSYGEFTDFSNPTGRPK